MAIHKLTQGDVRGISRELHYWLMGLYNEVLPLTDGSSTPSTSHTHDSLRLYVANYASLQAAITAIGATPCTLVINASVTISGTVSIPTTLTIEGEAGGLITVSSGTLTIGRFVGPEKIQYFAGAGTVLFGENAVEVVYPEWFGAVPDGDGGTDSGPALLAAVNAAPIGSTVQLTKSAHYYNAGTEIAFVSGHKPIIFQGPAKIWYGGSGKCISIAGGVGHHSVNHSLIRLDLQPSAGNEGNGTGVYIENTNYALLKEMFIHFFEVDIEQYATTSCESNRFERVTVGVWQKGFWLHCPYTALDGEELAPESENYKWTESVAKAGEFYVEDVTGGDPGLTEPPSLMKDDVALIAGTVGSLASGEWDWGDNDTLGYSTVYYKPSSGINPTDDTPVILTWDGVSYGGTESKHSMRSTQLVDCLINMRDTDPAWPSPWVGDAPIGLHVDRGVSLYQSNIHLNMHNRVENSIGIRVDGKLPALTGFVGFEGISKAGNIGWYFSEFSKYNNMDVWTQINGTEKPIAYHASCANPTRGLQQLSGLTKGTRTPLWDGHSNTVRRLVSLDDNGKNPTVVLLEELTSGGAWKWHIDKDKNCYFVDIADGQIAPVHLLPIPRHENISDESATPSVRGCGSIKFANANPTDVTDFSDGVAYQRLVVRSTSANTTLKNGTIKTASGADVVLSSTSCLFFWYDGTNWWQMTDAETFSGADWTDLTDGGETTLHTHPITDVLDLIVCHNNEVVCHENAIVYSI
jgi:hypothetical protein